MMKAVLVRQFAPFADATIEEVADPQPKANDVIVAVEAIETNYPDVLIMEGRYQNKPPFPFTPGKGVAGRVIARGADVKDLTIGQRVAVQLEHGAYAERVCADRSWCYPVPEGIDAGTAAASVLTYQTVWFALTDRAQMKAGDTVLVLGAGGGIGIAALQLAKALGAATVIAGTRGTAKADLARQAGADHVVDLSADDLRNSLRAQIHKLTDGRGVDIIIDPVGGAVFEPALRALAWRGRLVVVGFTGGDIPQVRTNYLLLRNIAVTGLQGSDYRDRWPEESAKAQEAIFDFILKGAFTPEISATFPLSRFPEALELLATGQARGKILLIPDAIEGEVA